MLHLMPLGGFTVDFAPVCWVLSLASNVYGYYRLRFVLTACRKEAIFLLPLAARKTKLVFP